MKPVGVFGAFAIGVLCAAVQPASSGVLEQVAVCANAAVNGPEKENLSVAGHRFTCRTIRVATEAEALRSTTHNPNNAYYVGRLTHALRLRPDDQISYTITLENWATDCKILMPEVKINHGGFFRIDKLLPTFLRPGSNEIERRLSSSWETTAQMIVMASVDKWAAFEPRCRKPEALVAHWRSAMFRLSVPSALARAATGSARAFVALLIMAGAGQSWAAGVRKPPVVTRPPEDHCVRQCRNDRQQSACRNACRIRDLLIMRDPLTETNAGPERAPILAATLGGGGLGFSCDGNTKVCTCDGVWEGADCQAMANNCERHPIVACRIVGKRTCSCTMSIGHRAPAGTAPLDHGTVAPSR